MSGRFYWFLLCPSWILLWLQCCKLRCFWIILQVSRLKVSKLWSQLRIQLVLEIGVWFSSCAACCSAYCFVTVTLSLFCDCDFVTALRLWLCHCFVTVTLSLFCDCDFVTVLWLWFCHCFVTVTLSLFCDWLCHCFVTVNLSLFCDCDFQSQVYAVYRYHSHYKCVTKCYVKIWCKTVWK